MFELACSSRYIRLCLAKLLLEATRQEMRLSAAGDLAENVRRLRLCVREPHRVSGPETSSVRSIVSANWEGNEAVLQRFRFQIFNESSFHEGKPHVAQVFFEEGAAL
jgi:hypothetical protein